jgi:sulfonate transport system substrate-binding protein
MNLLSRGLPRVLAALGLASLALAAVPQGAAASAPTTLRIGYQKYGTLTVLKARGDLDRRLAAQGIKVTWTQFPGGPQLLEALNVGALDYGTTGEAPTIFAQAAGANLVYVANEPPTPTAEAVVVPSNSPLKTVADLRGKRIALNKGSNVHYLLVRLLEKAGLSYQDIQPVYLAPADARAAFQRGAVDAWVIWDPFLAAAQQQLGARVIADATGLANNTQYFLASRDYAQQHPEVINEVFDELRKTEAWADTHPHDLVNILVPELGLDPAVVGLSASRLKFGIEPIGPAALADQQRIADAFYALKLIPRPVHVADAVLHQGN